MQLRFIGFGVLTILFSMPVMADEGEEESSGSSAQVSHDLYALCQEADGRFKWEVENTSDQMIPFSIVGADNDGQAVQGSALPSGQGNGSTNSRTIAYSMRAEGGNDFNLRIGAAEVRRTASLSPCEVSTLTGDEFTY